MSDDWIRILPGDPGFVPAAAEAQSLVDFAVHLFPLADEIQAHEAEEVTFIDAGTNFSAVACPGCAHELDLEWWIRQMERACESGFEDLSVSCPVCRTLASLNDLVYDWPQGFARWWLDVRNPGVGWLATDDVRRLSDALGHEIRIVYQHI